MNLPVSFFGSGQGKISYQIKMFWSLPEKICSWGVEDDLSRGPGKTLKNRYVQGVNLHCPGDQFDACAGVKDV